MLGSWLCSGCAFSAIVAKENKRFKGKTLQVNERKLSLNQSAAAAKKTELITKRQHFLNEGLTACKLK